MSKYHAVPTVVDGVRFHSKKEAARYVELKLLEKAGEITDLELQPEYVLMVGDVTIGRMILDFRYQENGNQVVEDVKSQPTKTTIYRWKKRHLKAQYGIEIREV